MKKKNQLIKVALLCMSLVAVLTMVFAANSKTKSKAGIKDWFQRISVNKCAISLDQDEFQWTGKQIKPEININYKGTELVKNVDYLLSYQNNVDAGTAKIIVEGKGDYKGKETVLFKINGIDFERECIVNIINKDNVEVYYQNQLLRKDLDYWYTVLPQAQLTQSVPAANGKYLNTYKVTTYYTIEGKGKFDGVITKKVITTEVKYENITWSNED